MQFEISANIEVIDDQGVETQQTVTNTYTAELTENGTLNVFQIVNEEPVHVLLQPWKFDATGARISWESLDEGIEWFKQEVTGKGV